MVTAPQAIVDLQHVTKRYLPNQTDAPALDDISLQIAAGEIFGIVGESGAGKSTLLELLNGLTLPTSGSVQVRGAEVTRLGRRELRALRRDIGMLFQGVHLLSNSTVRRNVELPLLLEGGSGAEQLSRAQRRSAVDEILAFVGLGDRADHFPAQLSGGERQRVGLARALVARPPLLLCDEPTSSLDASTTGDVLRILREARDELGTTVVVITHDLDVVKALCDRVALLEKGRLREVFEVAPGVDRSVPSYYEQVKRELMA